MNEKFLNGKVWAGYYGEVCLRTLFREHNIQSFRIQPLAPEPRQGNRKPNETALLERAHYRWAANFLQHEIHYGDTALSLTFAKKAG
jgi:hypothetical protein